MKKGMLRHIKVINTMVLSRRHLNRTQETTDIKAKVKA
jgi:hypothetical protein